MNQLLKQRIAQLKNGKIPTGYKKTVFGIFPCDWETDKRLKDLGVFGKGKGLPGEKMVSSGVPCVGYGDIYMKYNYHFEEAQSFVDEETASESQPIEKGTLLFTGTGETAEEIGKCVCYNGNETIYAGGDIITFVSKEVSPLFLAYQQYQDFSIRKKAGFGQGHSVVHIQRENLEKLPVAFPKSLSEQAKIAEILMTWDKAIELHKQQIEKLKQFKSVCLKKMFPAKGQTVPEWRFKGFTGEWERQRIDDLIKKGGSGGTPSTSHPEYYSGTIPFLSIADISNSNGNIFNTEKHITEEAVCASSAWIVPSGSISLAMYASVGKVAILKDNVATSQAFFNMILSEDSTRDYLYYYLKKMDEFGEWTPYISTGTQGNLNSETVRNLCVSIPKETTERRIIGNILNHIDSCITLYQRKLEAEQKRRKALQQYLLNGIMRV